MGEGTMDAVEFEGCNVTFAKDQSEYLPLPAHMSNDGIATSCWKLSFLEKLKVMSTGCIFVQTLTFHKPLQPLKMAVKKPQLSE